MERLNLNVANFAYKCKRRVPHLKQDQKYAYHKKLKEKTSRVGFCNRAKNTKMC